MVSSISPSSSSTAESPPSPLLITKELTQKSPPPSPRTTPLYLGLFFHNLFASYGSWLIGYSIYYYLTRHLYVYEQYLQYVFGDMNSPYARKYGSLLLIELIFWAGCSICYFLYWLNHPWMEQFKVNPHIPWPWYHPDLEKRQQFWKDFRSDLWHILKTQFIFTCCGEAFPLETRHDLLPHPIVELAWLKLLWTFEEGIHFICHSFMHSRYMYRFHKTHHAPTTTLCHHARYHHPIDFFITDAIPILIMGYWPIHRQTWIYFVISLNIRGIDDHCGYNMEPSFFSFIGVGPSGEYHYYHHNSFLHNYGSAWYDHLFRNDQYFSILQYQQHKTPEHEPYQYKIRAHAQQLRIVVEVLICACILNWM